MQNRSTPEMGFGTCVLYFNKKKIKKYLTGYSIYLKYNVLPICQNLNNSRRFGDGERDKQRPPSPSHSSSDDEDVILNSLKATSPNSMKTINFFQYSYNDCPWLSSSLSTLRVWFGSFRSRGKYVPIKCRLTEVPCRMA